jgi:cell wall-associated NlpC family hydrolase
MQGRDVHELERLVVEEARQWIGTPYHHHGRLKGIGVDCANLLCAVYEAAGLVEPIDPGFYDVAWHLHRNAEVFVEWLERAGAREIERPHAGAVGLWRFGRTYSHGGIFTTADGLVVHSYLGVGVRESRMNEEPLGSRPVRFWSLWQG